MTRKLPATEWCPKLQDVARGKTKHIDSVLILLLKDPIAATFEAVP
jgi:hypothetical protein